MALCGKLAVEEATGLS